MIFERLLLVGCREMVEKITNKHKDCLLLEGGSMKEDKAEAVSLDQNLELMRKELALNVSVEDSKFVISKDVTFDEKSLVALSKDIKPNDGDVTISNKQILEIESEDQPYSCRGQVENPIASEDEEEDERDHEEVQQENTHVLQQQQQHQESLDATRPKRYYKLVQKFGSDKPLRHYGQVNLVEYALS
ncbi:hypothetical protein KIW84_044645 [Lathyrus oleraceus]|uniref:Uncharacterized protein n=1 Tax=Pisum sativum TaxID=3888 RepID=A0A9D4XGN2_PEA|nr:hypothetical protein KIW84_044645 [Pisum sativum]